LSKNESNAIPLQGNVEQLGSISDDIIASCSQVLDNDHHTHETSHVSNHDGSQECITFGMTDDLNGCKVQNSESELSISSDHDEIKDTQLKSDDNENDDNGCKVENSVLETLISSDN